MADGAKYHLVSSVSDLKQTAASHLLVSSFPRKSKLFVYLFLFLFLFVSFTLFLAFSPPSSFSSSASLFGSYGSHFSSILSHFFPNSTSTSTSTSPRNSTALPSPASSGPRNGDSSGFSETNQTAKETKPNTRPPDPENLPSGAVNSSAAIGAVKGISASLSRKPTNISSISGAFTPPATAAKTVSVPAATNQTNSSSPAPATATSQTIPETTLTVAKNVTAPVSVPVVSNKTVSGSLVSGGGVAAKAMTEEEMVRQLVKCDLYDGDWVRDESYPVYYMPGSCNLIDEQFDCFGNGRPDTDFQKLKWKPKGCDLPR
ncbi:hypothetical protein Droror1_Dr00002272 [Drosera rotundifolia]